MEMIRVLVERVVYETEDFAILRARPEAELFHSVTLLGPLMGLGPGTELRVRGEWSQHPKYGEQLRVAEFSVIEPTHAEGMLRYLKSGSVEGLGEGLATRVVECFGDDTIRVLDEAPHRLTEIHGIGKVTAEKISRSWRDHRELRDTMLFLQSHGLGPGLAARIQQRYGGQATRMIREEPYTLIREVRGVGFATADRIANELGMEPESPDRILAGLEHVLDRALDEGHLYLPAEELEGRAQRLLSVDSTTDILEAAIGRGDLVAQDDHIYQPVMHEIEVDLARRIRDLADARERIRGTHRNVETDIDTVAEDQALDFSEEQREALRTALERKILVVTGGPGTGKTTLTVGLIRLFALRGLHVELAAPTGRAAKRLADAAGRPARTLHRLLAFDPESGTFTRNEDNVLGCDVLIIDEASMVDVPLMRELLRALPREARLILIGDVDQLPSVGPGTLLRDLIGSGLGGVVVLGQIFRQAAGSQIVANAHRINQGQQPDLSGHPDFAFVARNDPEEVAEMTTRLVAIEIPRRLGLEPREQVQVITPMYRGETGADELNRRLRDALNPEGPTLTRGKRIFREGDKVMQLRNSYQKCVFNGDQGIVKEVRVSEGLLKVAFGDLLVEYGPNDLDDLTSAYAITVHKSQGSEFPAVVLPITTQHYVMLQRNLLYTALTRARQLAVLVGTADAIRIAIGRDQVRRRYSGLKERLQQFGMTWS